MFYSGVSIVALPDVGFEYKFVLLHCVGFWELPRGRLRSADRCSVLGGTHVGLCISFGRHPRSSLLDQPFYKLSREDMNYSVYVYLQGRIRPPNTAEHAVAGSDRKLAVVKEVAVGCPVTRSGWWYPRVPRQVPPCCYT